MQIESDADVGWVAFLSRAPVARATAAVAEAAGERSLFGYLARQHAREGRESYVEIDAPLELYALARLARPEHLVEVGVSSGVSSAYLLSALKRNRRGRLHSIDRPSHERAARRGASRTRSSWSLPPGRSTGWAVPPRLLPGWDLRLGDMSYALPILFEQLPTVELLVFDVPHACSALERTLDRADARFPPGAIVIIDHGPGGDICPAITRTARRWRSEARLRVGLGLSGTYRPRS